MYESEPRFISSPKEILGRVSDSDEEKNDFIPDEISECRDK
jgi:hypothetical protein